VATSGLCPTAACAGPNERGRRASRLSARQPVLPHSRKKLGRIQNRGCRESPWRLEGLGSRLAVVSACLQSRDRAGAGPDRGMWRVYKKRVLGSLSAGSCLPASVCRYRSFAVTALSNGCACMISYPMKFQLSVPIGDGDPPAFRRREGPRSPAGTVGSSSREVESGRVGL